MFVAKLTVRQIFVRQRKSGWFEQHQCLDWFPAGLGTWLFLIFRFKSRVIMGGNTWNKSVDVFVIHFLGIPENLGEGFYFVILKAKFSDFKYFILCY